MRDKTSLYKTTRKWILGSHLGTTLGFSHCYGAHFKMFIHLKLKKTRFSNKSKTQIPGNICTNLQNKGSDRWSLSPWQWWNSMILQSLRACPNWRTFFPPDTRFLPAQQSLHFHFRTLHPHNSCAQISPRVKQREGPTSDQALHHLSGLHLVWAMQWERELNWGNWEAVWSA